VDFETALKEQFAARMGGKRLRRWERNLKELLEAGPSKKRTRILQRLERHARAALDLDARAAIDWSAIDWDKVFDFVMKVIMAILPLLLAL
jgi:hypothetical protein